MIHNEQEFATHLEELQEEVSQFIETFDKIVDQIDYDIREKVEEFPEEHQDDEGVLIEDLDEIWGSLDEVKAGLLRLQEHLNQVELIEHEL